VGSAGGLQLPRELISDSFDTGPFGFVFCLWIHVGDKWISFLFLICVGSISIKKGIATWLERNAFPKDASRQLNLMEERNCLVCL
jgi:putative Mn2+ efflux pump MntP